jgi:hypothetical protein
MVMPENLFSAFAEMVLKYQTGNFCNFQSNETRNEYEEEVPKV